MHLGATLEECPLAVSAETIGWGVAAWPPPAPASRQPGRCPRLAGAAEGNGEKVLLFGADKEVLAVTITS